MPSRDTGTRKVRRRCPARLRPAHGRRRPRPLRADRVLPLAEGLAGGVRAAGFEKLLSQIEDSPVHTGNRAEVFFRGADAFSAMLEAVAAARTELLLESYILRDDAI